MALLLALVTAQAMCPDPDLSLVTQSRLAMVSPRHLGVASVTPTQFHLGRRLGMRLQMGLGMGLQMGLGCPLLRRRRAQGS